MRQALRGLLDDDPLRAVAEDDARHLYRLHRAHITAPSRVDQVPVAHLNQREMITLVKRTDPDVVGRAANSSESWAH